MQSSLYILVLLDALFEFDHVGVLYRFVPQAGDNFRLALALVL